MKNVSMLVLMFFILIGCSMAQPTNEKYHSDPSDPILEEKGISYTRTNTSPSTSLQVMDYLLPKENSRLRTAEVTHVMLHFTSNAYYKPEDPYQMEEVYELFKEYGVSAHYLIDREGAIYQLVKEDRVAFHAGKGTDLNFLDYQNSINEYSIGVELLAIGTIDEMSMLPKGHYERIPPHYIGYTEEQYSALKDLLADIVERYDKVLFTREQIIGHDEYAPVRKSDPGSLFDWSKIGF